MQDNINTNGELSAEVIRNWEVIQELDIEETNSNNLSEIELTVPTGSVINTNDNDENDFIFNLTLLKNNGIKLEINKSNDVSLEQILNTALYFVMWESKKVLDKMWSTNEEERLNMISYIIFTVNNMTWFLVREIFGEFDSAKVQEKFNEAQTKVEELMAKEMGQETEQPIQWQSEQTQ